MKAKTKINEALGRDIQAFKELFRQSYGYIEIGDLPDDHFIPYVEMINNGKTSIEHALDLCQDGIMSQGLCEYYE